MKTVLSFLLCFVFVVNMSATVLSTITIKNNGEVAQAMGYRIDLIGKTGTGVAGVPASGDYSNIIPAKQSRTFVINDSDINPDYDIVGISQIMVGGAAELVGNSYVLPEGSTEDVTTGNYFEAPLQTTYNWQLGGEDDVNIKSGTPNNYKTLWVVRDGELTADLYREGVDKIVAASFKEPSSPGGTSAGPTAEGVSTPVDSAIAEAATAALDAIKTSTDGFATSFNTALDVAPSAVSISVPSVPGSYGFAAISTPSGEIPAINIFEFLPDITTWAGWIRELFLVGMGIAFILILRNLLLKYLAQWWGVTPKSTKVDVVSLTPVGGTAWNWGKQLATATAVVAVLVTVVALCIAGFNSNLGELMDGWTFTNGYSAAYARVNDVMNNSAVASTYALASTFFPFAAAFQFVFARYVFEWSLPLLWSGAMFASKYIEI